MSSSTATIDTSGRLVIPAGVRKALGLEPGAKVTLTVTDGELRIVSRGEAIRQAQERVAAHLRGSRRLSRELIAERRTEDE